MPERCIPLLRLRLFDAGSRGYATDPGWAWYSCLASDAQNWYDDGGYPYGAAVAPMWNSCLTMLLNGRIFVIPTPIEYPWDTLAADWTQDSGDWEERNDQSGLKVLHNLENEGQLSSNFLHPEGPSFCVSFRAYAVPKEWNQEDNPPYVSIRWGDPAHVADAMWELRLYQNGDLMGGQTAIDANYTFLGMANIGWHWPNAGEDPSTVGLMVLHIMGGIAVRATSDSAWHFFQDPAGDIWPADGGQFVIEHHGGQANLWFWGVVGPVPLLASTDTFNDLHSEIMLTDRVRAGNPDGVEARYEIPTVAAPNVAPDFEIDFVDHSGTDEVELVATLTWGYKSVQAPQAGRPLSYCFPYFPEFWASHVWFDPVVAAPAPNYVEILSELVHEADIVLPDEAQVGTATLDATWHVNDLGAFADYWFMRGVTIGIGWLYDDDSESITDVLTGYVMSTEPGQVAPKLVRARLTASDVSTPLRAVECDDNFPVMDGWNAEAAMVHIAGKIGIHSTLVNFVSCAGFDLSEGWPEEPLWLAQPGQLAWEFLERIARYCGQELVVAAGGGIASRPILFFEVGTVHNVPVTECIQDPPRVERRNAFGYTGVEMRGKLPGGGVLSSVVYDVNAENNPAYVLFQGFRRLELFDERGITDQLDCDDLAAIMYLTMRFRQGDRVVWTTRGYETALRRDCAFLTGTSIGVGDLDRLGIVGLRHKWGPRKPDCFTTWECCFYPT